MSPDTDRKPRRPHRAVSIPLKLRNALLERRKQAESLRRAAAAALEEECQIVLDMIAMNTFLEENSDDCCNPA